MTFTKKNSFAFLDSDLTSETEVPARRCDMPDCNEPADYRAPKSRERLRDYYWFCFNHVKEYNRNWDFFKGMSSAQIEEQLRSAVTWDKPSWKLGQLGKKRMLEEQMFRDPLHILPNMPRKPSSRKKKTVNSIPAPLQNPLKLLGLAWPLSLEDLKKRYMTLARQYHPDTNGGNLELEERFKHINAAYSQKIGRAHV